MEASPISCYACGDVLPVEKRVFLLDTTTVRFGYMEERNITGKDFTVEGNSPVTLCSKRCVRTQLAKL